MRGNAVRLVRYPGVCGALPLMAHPRRSVKEAFDGSMRVLRDRALGSFHLWCSSASTRHSGARGLAHLCILNLLFQRRRTGRAESPNQSVQATAG